MYIARSATMGTPLVTSMRVATSVAASGNCPEPAGNCSSSTGIVRRLRGGTTRWLTSPSSVGWELPDLAFVMKVLASGVVAEATHRVPSARRVSVGRSLVGA
jgi:hypothetical protein